MIGPQGLRMIALCTSFVGAWTMVIAVAAPIGILVKALLILTGVPVDR